MLIKSGYFYFTLTQMDQYRPSSCVMLSLALSGPLMEEADETLMYLSRINPLSIPRAS